MTDYYDTNCYYGVPLLIDEDQFENRVWDLVDKSEHLDLDVFWRDGLQGYVAYWKSTLKHMGGNDSDEGSFGVFNVDDLTHNGKLDTHFMDLVFIKELEGVQMDGSPRWIVHTSVSR